MSNSSKDISLSIEKPGGSFIIKEPPKAVNNYWKRYAYITDDFQFLHRHFTMFDSTYYYNTDYYKKDPFDLYDPEGFDFKIEENYFQGNFFIQNYEDRPSTRSYMKGGSSFSTVQNASKYFIYPLNQYFYFFLLILYYS